MSKIDPIPGLPEDAQAMLDHAMRVFSMNGLELSPAHYAYATLFLLGYMMRRLAEDQGLPTAPEWQGAVAAAVASVCE